MDTMTQAEVQTSDTILDGHQCDRCGAPANVSADKGEQVLLFCRHHWREVKSGVIDWAERVVIWSLDPKGG